MTKKLLKKAEFAQPSLLSAVPNAVKVGAGVGAGLGLLQGSGVLESDAEKKATNVGNRLGKVLTSTTIGTGLGAGVGYGVNRYRNSPERQLEKLRAEVAQAKAAEAAVIPNRVKREVEAVKQVFARPTESQALQEEAAELAKKADQRASQPEKPPLVNQFLDRGKEDWEKTQKAVGGLLNRLTGKNNIEASKNMKNISNFQDSATIQRLIQHGSTYIPQNNTGVVRLESTLRGKMQKKKLREPKVPASMSVKEINSMIESGKPVGKYFSKTIRKSANFLKRQQQAEFSIGDQINKGLVSVGKLITQPAAKTLRKAATKAGGGNIASVTGNRIVASLPFGIADKVNYGAAKAAVGTHDALNSAARVLDTDKAAKYVAIGVGGTALAGGGLLAAKLAQKKQEDEARYSKTIRKSASFGIIPAGLVSGAQKAAAGTAKRFASTSPLINAANVGTAVGAGLGALEGSGINETEEQRRSTGLVGRAGKVLGMTGLGAVVGRGVGSAAGYGIDKYQTSQKWNARNKARAAKSMPSSTDKPTKINIQDQDE
jgi:hypothetical protein